MEINYFLDSQQIMYENLIADVGLEGELCKSAACEARPDEDENNDDTTMKTDTDNKEGGEDDASEHDKSDNDDDDNESRNDVDNANGVDGD